MFETYATEYELKTAYKLLFFHEL